MDPDRSTVYYGVRRRMQATPSGDVFGQFSVVGLYAGFAALLLFSLHVLMARLLSPSAYADYGVYVGALFTVFLASTSIQLVITRFVTYYDTRSQQEQINYLVSKSLQWMFVIGLVLCVLIILLSQHINQALDLSSIQATIFLGFALIFTLMQPVFEGAFRGLEQFQALGRMRLIEAATRFIAVLSAVWLGFSLVGAVFGLGLGTIVALAASYHHVYALQKLSLVTPRLDKVRKFAIPLIIMMSSFALLINIDVFLAKYFFSSQLAGSFVAASFFGKVPVLVSLVLIGVLFPKFTRLHANGKNPSRLLSSALKGLSVFALIFTLISVFFADTIGELLFSSAYSLGSLFGLYVFGMCLLAVSVVLNVYLVAIGDETLTFWLSLFVVLFVVLVSLAHQSVNQVFLSSMIVMTILTACSLYAARSHLEFDYFLR